LHFFSQQTPTSRIYSNSKENTIRNFGLNKGVVWNKSGFRRTKAALSLKRGKIGPRLLLTTNRKSHSYALLIGAKINDLGWHWRVIMHSVSNASFGAHPWKSEWRETYLKAF